MGADFVCLGVSTYYPKRCMLCGGRHPPVSFLGPFAQFFPRFGSTTAICRLEEYTDGGLYVHLEASGDNVAAAAICLSTYC